MALLILQFFGSLVLLLVAARFFTRSAESLGNTWGLPPFVTGIFIVGIGTSLPELVTGILSTWRGTSEIVVGNLIGSNVSNLLLLLGLSMVVTQRAIQLGPRYLMIDLHYLLGSALLFYLFIFDGVVHFSEALIGLVLFVLYSIYLIRTGSSEVDENAPATQRGLRVGHLLILIASAVGIFFGADRMLDAMVQGSELLEIPPPIVALTVLSLGTTLPELAVNLVAMWRGQSEMAVGNILGSCIFNLLVIPAGAAAVGSLHVPESILTFPAPFLLAATAFFYLLTLVKKMSPWEGALFIAIYVVFVLKSTGLG